MKPFRVIGVARDPARGVLIHSQGSGVLEWTEGGERKILATTFTSTIRVEATPNAFNVVVGDELDVGGDTPGLIRWRPRGAEEWRAPLKVIDPDAARNDNGG